MYVRPACMKEDVAGESLYDFLTKQKAMFYFLPHHPHQPPTHVPLVGTHDGTRQAP